MDKLLVERVAFTIFGLDIYWYGIIITSAILIGFGLLFVLRKRAGLGADVPFDLMLFVVPLAILGARTFSVIFEPSLGIADFFDIRNGGMSIIGSCIGGAIGITLYCIVKKKNFLSICDLICPLLLLGQAIGRWGNFFNSEVYGKEILDTTLQWFPLAVNVGGRWFMALFFYESVLDFLGFVILISLYYLSKRSKGVILASYLTYYGLVRFVLESFRQERYILKWGSVPISKLCSGIMVIIGVVLFIVIFIQSRKESKGKVNYGKKRV